MGMTERLEEAQFAVEVANAAINEWQISSRTGRTLSGVAALHILEADLCRARGVLLAIQRRQAAAMVDDDPANGDQP